MQVTVAVCVFAFDLLYVDGSPLVHLPLRERRLKLQAALPQLSPGHVQIARSIELQAATIAPTTGPPYRLLCLAFIIAPDVCIHITLLFELILLVRLR